MFFSVDECVEFLLLHRGVASVDAEQPSCWAYRPSVRWRQNSIKSSFRVRRRGKSIRLQAFCTHPRLGCECGKRTVQGELFGDLRHFLPPRVRVWPLMLAFECSLDFLLEWRKRLGTGL